MRQLTLFDIGEDEKGDDVVVEREEKEEKRNNIRDGMMVFKGGDCVFREGYHCSKLGCVVAVDMRGSVPSCWNRMFCEFFVRKV